MVKAHLTGKDTKMKQMLGLLFVSLLGGLWLSLKRAECRILSTTIPTCRPNMSYCNNTNSGKTCFTTLLVDNSRTARKTFKKASHWCKTYVPGSSLIVINSLEIQRAFECFILRQVLEHDTIIMDAQMLSASEGQKWSWVNGQPYSPDVAKDISRRAEQFHYGACVESKSKPSKSVNYCFGNVTSMFRYICEISDSKSNNSYQKDNKSYVASEEVATWFYARNECLRLGGDLASITNLRAIINWSSLKENQEYWIGLHRNKWIWNSTGAALTYTNWKNGFPDESSDKQCICFIAQCSRENGIPKCEAANDRKWRTCNCNANYAIVCQKDFPFPEEKILSSTSADFKSSVTLSAETTTQLRISSSSPSFSASTSGLFNSFGIKEILIILLLFVAVVFIVVAIFLIIRKRKYDYKRNEGSSIMNTNQSEAVSSVYATVVPVNRPSEVNVPPGNTIYADVEMTHQSTPPTSNTIYASVQPTSEAADMGKSVVYADLDFLKKDRQKPRSGDKMTACLSPNYSQPYEPRTSASNTEYAEPFKPDKRPTATAPVLNHHNAAGDQRNISAC